MVKKIITMAALITCLASSAAFAYVGNSHSYKFHIEGCRAEQKIRADHRVYFATRDEAIQAGYVPCGICNP